MASSGRQRQLDQQQQYWNAQAQQQFQQASQPDPLETAYRQRQQAFLNWDNSANKNVVDAPGMSDYIQIGQAALRRANQERMGTGALRLSDGGASGYAEKLKSERQAEMGREVGAGLESALAGRRAEAQGSVMPLSQLGLSRSMGLAGMASQNNNAYLNRPRQQPFWQQLLLGGMQAGAQVATGWLGNRNNGG